jgi:hypothetical protein
VFRLPLNLLVVVGTMLTDGAQEVRALQFVYGVVVAMLSVAMLLQLALLALPASNAAATAGASGCSAKEKQQ